MVMKQSYLADWANAFAVRAYFTSRFGIPPTTDYSDLPIVSIAEFDPDSRARTYVRDAVELESLKSASCL